MIVRPLCQIFSRFKEVALFWMKKRVAVPPYPCVEQQNGSYGKWSVWLCEHCVKFSADSDKKRVANWPYRCTQALNRHGLVMKNDQYDCANIMWKFCQFRWGRIFFYKKLLPIAVPPYPCVEQENGSYRKWSVWLCEHCVKFSADSKRSHFFGWKKDGRTAVPMRFYYFRLYDIYYALNREVPIIKNAQYSHATNLRYCMEKSKRSHISDIDRRTAVPVRWTGKW